MVAISGYCLAGLFIVILVVVSITFFVMYKRRQGLFQPRVELNSSLLDSSGDQARGVFNMSTFSPNRSNSPILRDRVSTM